MGVNENLLANTTVYPNPATHKLFIASNEPITSLVLRDMLGRNIDQFKSSSPIREANIESLSQGIYFVTLKTEEGAQKTIKIIKK